MKEVSSSISTHDLFKPKALPNISRYSPSSNKLLYLNVPNNKYAGCQSMRDLNKKLLNVNTQYNKFKETNRTINSNNKYFSKMYKLFYSNNSNNNETVNQTLQRNRTIETDLSQSWRTSNQMQASVGFNKPENIFGHSLILIHNDKLKYLTKTPSSNEVFQSEGSFLSKCALRLNRVDLSNTHREDDENSHTLTTNMSSATQTIYLMNALKIKKPEKKETKPIRNQIRELNGLLNSFVSILSEKKEEEEHDPELKTQQRKRNINKDIKPILSQRPVIKPKPKRQSLVKVYNKVLAQSKQENFTMNSVKSFKKNTTLISNYFKKHWKGNINRIFAKYELIPYSCSRDESSSIHKTIVLSQQKALKTDVNKVFEDLKHRKGELLLNKNKLTTLNLLDNQISTLDKECITNLLK